MIIFIVIDFIDVLKLDTISIIIDMSLLTY